MEWTVYLAQIKKGTSIHGGVVARVYWEDDLIKKIELCEDGFVWLPYLKDETPVTCLKKKMNKIFKLKTLGDLRKLA